MSLEDAVSVRPPSDALAPGWLIRPAEPDALAPGIWPTSARRDAAGMLEIAGVGTSRLAAEHGTPLYVLDEEDARARARRIREAFARAFAETDVHVYYAGKALLSIDVVRWMLDEGLRIDVCTGGELAVALAAGADPALLGLHGNAKSPAEIDRAVSVGIGAIVIDSALELDRVIEAARRHGRTQAVRIRVNSGVHASTHAYLATAAEDQKFGTPLADVPALVERIRASDALELLGLHAHIGSQIFDSEGFAESARRLLDLHARLSADGPVPELNLGGGFGIAYTSADEPIEIESIAEALSAVVRDLCGELGIAVPAIAIEPGRWIVGPAGITLYEVGTIKDVPVARPDGTLVRRYVSVDGGMSDNLRPALYGADYTARLAGRSSSEAAVISRVVGRHCESGDIVVRDEYLPGDTGPGDLLAVAATGAYCHSLASNYNHVTRPALVAVRDGSSRVLIRRETEDDLLARDLGARVDPARADARTEVPA